MKELSEILCSNGVLDFGVMSFSQIPALIECRAKARLPERAKSVIMCVFPYNVGELEGRNICRYATVIDYHNYIGLTLSTICDKLSQMYNNNFAYFVDSSPIPEVFCAVSAGLGFRGKNNLLITKKYGSYVVLGEIVTDMVLPISAPNEESCLDCGKCKTNCPNGAIGLSCVEYSRCVSNISQRKGELTADEILAIKRAGLAWGCDHCQDICPHNKLVATTPIKEFLQDVEPLLTKDNLDSLMKTRAYGYKG
ncbi:MAG: QueG-associated DUF1730 domain-containing protein, partial [Oscillospiraceae bacterium]